MKPKLFLQLLFILFLSCKKDGNNSSSLEKKVEYQLNASGYLTLAAQYNNEEKQQVSANVSNGWKYGFSVKEKPFTLYLRGVMTPTGSSPSLEIKIVVDGQVVASKTGGTGNWLPEVQYVIQ